MSGRTQHVDTGMFYSRPVEHLPWKKTVGKITIYIYIVLVAGVTKYCDTGREQHTGSIILHQGYNVPVNL